MTDLGFKRLKTDSSVYVKGNHRQGNMILDGLALALPRYVTALQFCSKFLIGKLFHVSFTFLNRLLAFGGRFHAAQMLYMRVHGIRGFSTLVCGPTSVRGKMENVTAKNGTFSTISTHPRLVKAGSQPKWKMWVGWMGPSSTCVHSQPKWNCGNHG
jgi:hypothetical protein